MDVKLSVQSGGRHDRTIPIGDGDFVIGRDLSCHYRVDHDRVGHHHCRIRLGGGKVVVEDLNSIHGTLVNDQAIRKHEARDGDRLRVGPMTFVFQIAAPGGAPKGQPGAWAGGGEPDRLAPRAVSRNPLDSNFESPATLSARQLLARMTGQPGAGDLDKGLRVVEHEGIAVVRPLEEAVVEDESVRRIAHELDRLIDAGRDRIVLNLEVVENLSIQAVGMIVEVRDRCAAAGGLLKLCRLSPPLARALTLMNLDGQFEVADDEPSALGGPWTGSAGATAGPAPKAALARLRLVALLGRARGKAIEIGRAKFVIGRDPSCHLRPNSPAISRLHTVLEQRGGRVIVRDLGAKNGTILNGRLLRGEEAEIAHGDRLQIGPLLFAVGLGDREVPLGPEELGDASESWLIGAPAASAGGARPTPEPQEEPGADSTLLVELPPGGFEAMTAPPEPRRPPAPAAAAPVKDLAYTVVDGALLVTILAPDLNDEPEVGPVRYELCTLLEREDLPRRVVISLGRVRYLSSRAVGVLLAHYQRLSRLGGTMRLSDVSPNLIRVLDQMRLPMLIDVYPTAEEALRDPWG